MKKSVLEAQKRALQISEEHPDLTVRVLDKHRKHAVINTSDWAYRERVLKGWHTVATFRDGKQLHGPEKVTCDCCTDKGHCPEYKSGAACVNDRKEPAQCL